MGQRARKEYFTAFATRDPSPDDKIFSDRAHRPIVNVHICCPGDLPKIRQAANKVIEEQRDHSAVNTSSATMVEGRELHRSLGRIRIPLDHEHRNDQRVIATRYVATNIQASLPLPVFLEQRYRSPQMIVCAARTRLRRLTAGNKILQAPEGSDEFHIRMTAIGSRIEAPRTRDTRATVTVARPNLVSQ